MKNYPACKELKFILEKNQLRKLAQHAKSGSSPDEALSPSGLGNRGTLDKCIVLRIGTLTGCPLCMESHPLCRLKNPTVILIWLLVGFHPATRSVQSTPADNTRKRVWQYIEKERKKEKDLSQVK